MELLDFAKLIRHKRISKGLTQAGLAELLSVSTTTVCKWETSVGFPDVMLFDDISAVLEIPKSELLNYSYAKKTHSSVNARYTGILIKEALADSSVLDYAEITGVALQSLLLCGKKEIRYATCIEFSSDKSDFPEMLSKSLLPEYCAELDAYSEKDGRWFDAKHLIVFSDAVLSYRNNDFEGKKKVQDELIARGFSELPRTDPFKRIPKKEGKTV